MAKRTPQQQKDDGRNSIAIVIAVIFILLIGAGIFLVIDHFGMENILSFIQGNSIPTGGGIH